MNSEFLSRSSPRPAFESPEAAKYNIKIGRLSARLYGSIQMEINDNINLSEKDPIADISVGPSVKLGFIYTVSPNHTLQLSLGGGYRWYLNSPSLATVSLDPSSRIDYKITIGDVQLTVSDAFSVDVDPTSVGQLNAGGTQSSASNFRRLHNSTGLTANWQPFADVGFSAGYDYGIDRTLTSSFAFLDRDEHGFNAGTFYSITSRSTLGLNGSYILTYYTLPQQNDGTQISVGPSWNFKVTKNITFNANLGYTLATYDHTGTFTDNSDFAGLTYRVNLQQTVNSRFTHRIQASRFIGQGVGGNFTDILAAQYTANQRMTRALTLNSSLTYENLASSGGNKETADRFLLSLGTNYRWTKRWTAGFAYAFTLKESDVAGLSYRQNRFTIEMGRQF